MEGRSLEKELELRVADGHTIIWRESLLISQVLILEVV